MKVNTNVEINDEALLKAIAKEFIIELGLVNEDDHRYYCRYELAKDVRILVKDMFKNFLKENKETIIKLCVKEISDKFNHATNKKMIVEMLLKELKE